MSQPGMLLSRSDPSPQGAGDPGLRHHLGGLGTGLWARKWRGVCSQPIARAPAPGKPHTTGHGVRCSLPHVLGELQLPKPSADEAQTWDISTMCPEASDSQRESREVTARVRQKYICKGEIKNRICNNCAVQIPIKTWILGAGGEEKLSLVCRVPQGEKSQQTELAGSHWLEGHVPSFCPLSALR